MREMRELASFFIILIFLWDFNKNRRKEGVSVVDIATETFLIDEPMNAAVGLAEDGPCQDLDDYCRKTMLEGLSFKAVDADGNIIGVTISGISTLESSADFFTTLSNQCSSKKFAKILYILIQRENGAKLQERFPNEHTMVEVKFAATDPGWRKCGIMKELMRVTEKAVLDRGIRLVRMDTSSEYSARSAERLGYTCVYKARYADIKQDGVAQVLPAPPHVHDCVYIKQL